MRLKIPEQLIYLLAGSLLAFIVMSLCSRKNEKVPKSIIVEPQIETLKVFKVIPMKPETVLTQRVYHKNETVYVEPPKVINWREYVYEDKQIKLSVEADTVKSAIYKVKPEYKIIPVQSEPKPKKNFVMFTACNHSLFLNYSREYKYNLSSFWALENFRPSLGNIQLTYSPVPWFSIGTGWDFWKNEPEIVAGINFSF